MSVSAPQGGWHKMAYTSSAAVAGGTTPPGIDHHLPLRHCSGRHGHSSPVNCGVRGSSTPLSRTSPSLSCSSSGNKQPFTMTSKAASGGVSGRSSSARHQPHPPLISGEKDRLTALNSSYIRDRDASADSQLTAGGSCRTDTSSPSYSGRGGVSDAGEGVSRFPKLAECAHFHYETVELGPLLLQLYNNDDDEAFNSSSSSFVHTAGDGSCSDQLLFNLQVTSNGRSWLLRRSYSSLRVLDQLLHECIYDRKFSCLPTLPALSASGDDDGAKQSSQQQLQLQEDSVRCLMAEYLHGLSHVAGSEINCAPVLCWLEMDNRGNKLLAPANSDINTPAVAAALVVKRCVSHAADEISLEVGDMISVIDMTTSSSDASGGDDCEWWRGKRGFQVGYFPCQCVRIIDEQLSSGELLYSLEAAGAAGGAMTAAGAGVVDYGVERPVFRKRAKLVDFFRNFIHTRPSRRRLKQSGILKERVFGCDLGEHLINFGLTIPIVLQHCAEYIETHGVVDGIYRLSGVSSNIQKLRNAFDEGCVPDLQSSSSSSSCVAPDIHSVSCLLKQYFRELPNPLLTFRLYDQFVAAVQCEDHSRLLRVRDVVQQLPPPHYRTLDHLIGHLYRLSQHSATTGMTAKNLAIVWAPNLVRSIELEGASGVAALQGVGVQAVVVEFLIRYRELIFSDKLPAFSDPAVSGGDVSTVSVDSSAQPPAIWRHSSTWRRSRPKSLAVSTPTKLLTLEEARLRTLLPPAALPSVAGSNIPPNQAFIDVGGGPSQLPAKYHTVIDLPQRRQYRRKPPVAAAASDLAIPSGAAGMRLKRSPLLWKSLLFRRARHTSALASAGAANALLSGAPLPSISPHSAATASKTAVTADLNARHTLMALSQSSLRSIQLPNSLSSSCAAYRSMLNLHDAQIESAAPDQVYDCPPQQQLQLPDQLHGGTATALCRIPLAADAAVRTSRLLGDSVSRSVSMDSFFGNTLGLRMPYCDDSDDTSDTAVDVGGAVRGTVWRRRPTHVDVSTCALADCRDLCVLSEADTLCATSTHARPLAGTNVIRSLLPFGSGGRFVRRASVETLTRSDSTGGDISSLRQDDATASPAKRINRLPKAGQLIFAGESSAKSSSPGFVSDGAAPGLIAAADDVEDDEDARTDADLQDMSESESSPVSGAVARLRSSSSSTSSPLATAGVARSSLSDGIEQLEKKLYTDSPPLSCVILAAATAATDQLLDCQSPAHPASEENIATPVLTVKTAPLLSGVSPARWENPVLNQSNNVEFLSRETEDPATNTGGALCVQAVDDDGDLCQRQLAEFRRHLQQVNDLVLHSPCSSVSNDRADPEPETSAGITDKYSSLDRKSGATNVPYYRNSDWSSTEVAYTRLQESRQTTPVSTPLSALSGVPHTDTRLIVGEESPGAITHISGDEDTLLHNKCGIDVQHFVAEVITGDSGGGGDVLTGDSGGGDVLTGDSGGRVVLTGDSGGGGDVLTGDSGGGDVLTGDSGGRVVLTGDSDGGDVLTGDSGGGDVLTGDSGGGGDVLTGDSGGGGFDTHLALVDTAPHSTHTSDHRTVNTPSLALSAEISDTVNTSNNVSVDSTVTTSELSDCPRMSGGVICTDQPVLGAVSTCSQWLSVGHVSSTMDSDLSPVINHFIPASTVLSSSPAVVPVCLSPQTPLSSSSTPFSPFSVLSPLSPIDSAVSHHSAAGVGVGHTLPSSPGELSSSLLRPDSGSPAGSSQQAPCIIAECSINRECGDTLILSSPPCYGSKNTSSLSDDIFPSVAAVTGKSPELSSYDGDHEGLQTPEHVGSDFFEDSCSCAKRGHDVICDQQPANHSSELSRSSESSVSSFIDRSFSSRDRRPRDIKENQASHLESSPGEITAGDDGTLLHHSRKKRAAADTWESTRVNDRPVSHDNTTDHNMQLDLSPANCNIIASNSPSNYTSKSPTLPDVNSQQLPSVAANTERPVRRRAGGEGVTNVRQLMSRFEQPAANHPAISSQTPLPNVRRVSLPERGASAPVYTPRPFQRQLSQQMSAGQQTSTAGVQPPQHLAATTEHPQTDLLLPSKRSAPLSRQLSATRLSARERTEQSADNVPARRSAIDSVCSSAVSAALLSPANSSASLQSTVQTAHHLGTSDSSSPASDSVITAAAGLRHKSAADKTVGQVATSGVGFLRTQMLNIGTQPLTVTAADLPASATDSSPSAHQGAVSSLPSPSSDGSSARERIERYKAERRSVIQRRLRAEGLHCGVENDDDNQLSTKLVRCRLTASDRRPQPSNRSSASEPEKPLRRSLPADHSAIYCQLKSDGGDIYRTAAAGSVITMKRRASAASGDVDSRLAAARLRVASFSAQRPSRNSSDAKQ